MSAVLILALTAVALAAVLLLLSKLDRSGPAGLAARVRYAVQRSRVAHRHGFTVAGLDPEAGALTLAMAANLSVNDLQRGVLETFVMESSVLDRLPLMSIDGNAYAYNEESRPPRRRVPRRERGVHRVDRHVHAEDARRSSSSAATPTSTRSSPRPAGTSTISGPRRRR